MIGQGLNSLIPPREPQKPEQSTGQAQGSTQPQAPQAQPQVPVSAIPAPNQSQSIRQAQDASRIAEVIHVDPEQMRADQHAESAIKAIHEAAEYPNVAGVEVTPQERADVARDVAYHTLAQDDSEFAATKRAVGFSKKTALHDAIFHIEVDKIKPNPYQPRKHFDEGALKDLASSIREFGILQPLVVSKVETETDSGTKVEYQLIAGERRLMASKRAGLERVPVIIRQAAERAEQLELAIIENLQRENLDTIEMARSYARLQDEFGMTQR